MLTIQLPMPEQAPFQLVKVDPMGAVAVSDPDTRGRLAAFLDHKANKVQFKA